MQVRFRSQSLLSGVSTIAVLAAFGVADPALATQAVTGPGAQAAVTNAGADTDIAVSAGAVVQTDVPGNSVTNTGTLTGAADSLSIDASTILGNIVNSGTMAATGANDGIDIRVGSVVVGGITNSNLISGSEDGIEINASTLLGGITNSGTASQILGATNAILFSGNSVILGGIANEGLIAGSSNGIHSADAQVDFIGDITNSATGTISGAGAGNGAINLELINTFIGEITNSGLITATDASALGISLDSGAFTGTITNASTGTISTTGASAVTISLTGGTVTADLSNSGLILASGSSAAALMIDGAVFDGTIVNTASGVISAAGSTGIAIYIASGTLTGGIDNAGNILATGANGVAIQIDGDDFDGGITNAATGLISADATAVGVGTGLANFGGDITNAGTILSASNAGISFAGTVLDGNITNAAGALITAGTNGIAWAGGTITGDVTNAGEITAGSAAIALNGTLISGAVGNTGTISGATGISLGATGTVAGDLTNDGNVIATAAGIDIAGLVSGSLVNTGLIDPLVGIDVSGDITGGLFNTGGTIVATSTGILVTGNIAGGIVNSGTIIGDVAGIDLDGAGSATAVTMTGGLLQGGEGGTGTIGTALSLNNAFADTFTADAGVVDGDIDAAGGDDMLMGGGGTFTWLRGTGAMFDQFDAVGGTVLLGGTHGQEDGQGVTVSAASMAVTGSHVYLDDDTSITLTGAFDASGGEGVIEWQLTPDNTTYAVITAATGDLGADTQAAVHINPAEFAAANMLPGNAGTIVYQDVITTGGLVGAFANANTITTSSAFFTGTAIEDAANNIDIVLMRTSFATALAASGATQSANQASVGAALETIYVAGGVSSDFEHFYEELFEGDLSTHEIQELYDEVAGAEHADVQEIGMRASHAFIDAIGRRMDDMKSGGHKSAGLGLRRYAEAAATTATDASPAEDISRTPSGMRGSLGLSVWGRTYEAWTSADGDLEAVGYDQSTRGAIGGVDVAVDEEWMIGAAMGLSSTDVDFVTRGDGADLDSFHMAAYAAYESGHYYADALLSVGFHDVSSMRLIDLGFDVVAALANYDSDTVALHGEAGAVFEAGRYMIQPFVALAYTSSSTDAFVEGGAGGFNLLVGDTSADSLTSSLGVRFSGTWKVGGVRLIPDAEIAWRHEYLDERQSFSGALLEDIGTNLRIVSSALARDAAVIGAGVGAQVSKRLVLFLDYNGVISDTTDTHTASAGLRATW